MKIMHVLLHVVNSLIELCASILTKYAILVRPLNFFASEDRLMIFQINCLAKFKNINPEGL